VVSGVVWNAIMQRATGGSAKVYPDREGLLQVSFDPGDQQRG
jgi:hypothetical protein